MTEHILNVAFSFDDSAIEKKLNEQGYQDLIRMLCEKAEKAVGRSYYCSQSTEVNWKNFVDSAIDRFVEANKDEITELAVLRIAEKITRTKAFREKFSEQLTKA